MAFLDRYAADRSRPSVRQAGTDLARRALLPAAGLWAVIVVIGLLIVGPGRSLPRELAINRALESARTPAWDAVTALFTNVASTEFVIAVALIVAALLWFRTKQWWLTIVPLIAVTVQTAVFITSAAIVARDRPEVDRLDDAPPTSSFPSGHAGASAALYLSLAVLAQRIQQPVLRWVTTSACLVVPVFVGFSRLYRGMHNLSDVVVGLANGLICAWLAWHYLRRESQTRPNRARANE